MTEQMDKHETVETDALQSADADVSGDQETFTPRQQQLLVALVRDANVQVAAQAVGVSRTTAHQWMKQPAFQEELTRQRDAILGEALANVRTHAARAVTELATLLTDPDRRLRRLACNDILDHALKIRNTEDIERRLLTLEKTIKKSNRKIA